MSLPLPKRLQPGDTVGIVSTSSPTTPDALERTKGYLERRGYTVKVAPNVLASYGFMAGTAQTRADDLNHMLRDPTVRMIVTSTGGRSAAHLLPLIDYGAIASDPKIVIGLSDPSILLNAITSVTGVPTFHGPNGYNFGHAQITRFSEENFWPLVGQDLDIPYIFPVGDEIKVVREGNTVEGRLYGGHLGTNQVLVGTPWAPDWRDSILFIEEMIIELDRTDAMLTHLRLAGILDAIKGLIVGQFVECKEGHVETLEDVLLRNCAGYEFPIIANVPLGHTDDKITLPIGTCVRLNPVEASLELLESPTC
jgi:muramoyltetrapeptide carboxypeptidase